MYYINVSVLSCLGSVPNGGVSANFVSVEATKQRLRRGTSLGRCRIRRNIGGANRRHGKLRFPVQKSLKRFLLTPEPRSGEIRDRASCLKRFINPDFFQQAMATSSSASSTATSTIRSLEGAVQERLGRILNPFPTLHQQYSALPSNRRSAFEAFACQYPYYLEGVNYGDCIRALDDTPDLQRLARQYRFAHQLVRFFDEYTGEGNEERFSAGYLRQESRGRTLLQNLRNNGFSFDELARIAAEMRPELALPPSVVSKPVEIRPVSDGENTYSFLPRPFETLVSEALWELELGNRFPAFEDVFPLDNQYFEQILQSHDGTSKLERLAEASSFLGEQGFTAYHLYTIVRGKGWEAKLDRVDRDVEKYKALGLNGYHLSQIMKNAGWEAKLDRIASDFEKYKALGLNGYHVSQIMKNAGWEAKLDWVETDYSRFRSYGLSAHKAAHQLQKADWRDWVVGLASKEALLDKIYLDDERISPFAESYLRMLVFNGHSAEEVSGLIEACTYDRIERFKDDLDAIAGSNGAKTPDDVIGILHERFGYAEEQVVLYLKAINKNKAGLLSWYTTGVMYAVRERSFDETLERRTSTAEPSPEELVEREETRTRLFELLRQKATQTYPLMRRLIVDYGGDIESLTTPEREQFNTALNQLRTDKPLMAELYELLD